PAAASPWVAVDGFTPNLPGSVHFTLQLRSKQRAVEIQTMRGQITIAVDGVSIPAAHLTRAEGFAAACLDGARVPVRTFVYDRHVHVWLDGEHYDCLYDDPRLEEFSASASLGDLTTPLPGVVAAVAVAVGQTVAAGEVLMVIEAMKMEHTIAAPYAGTVQS